MIGIGEKTGELENMLTQVSDSYDFQVNNSIEGFTSLLTPVMLVFMGGVIGIIAFAILVPIFEMSGMGDDICVMSPFSQRNPLRSLTNLHSIGRHCI